MMNLLSLIFGRKLVKGFSFKNVKRHKSSIVKLFQGFIKMICRIDKFMSKGIKSNVKKQPTKVNVPKNVISFKNFRKIAK